MYANGGNKELILLCVLSRHIQHCTFSAFQQTAFYTLMQCRLCIAKYSLYVCAVCGSYCDLCHIKALEAE